MAALLQLDKATIRFGGLTAVNAVDFTVNEGELCGLIGPNGAGKTTVFNLITGVYQPTDGVVLLHGQRDERADSLARRGGPARARPHRRQSLARDGAGESRWQRARRW